MKLTVCLLASEAAPLSKTGGLADVSGALTKYLHSIGHDVRLFTPLYKSIDRVKIGARPVGELQHFEVRVGPHRYLFSLLLGQLPGTTAPVYLLDCPVLFERATIYTTDSDEHLRFLAFTRAVFGACQRMHWSPQIMHCNDWHTALAPLFLKSIYEHDPFFRHTRSLITIHNIGYQGVFSAAAVNDLELGPKTYLLHQDDLRAGKINALRQGIMYADAITTVSPTHAREICTDQYGMGLQDSLRARSGALIGILNGVDYDDWDPRDDAHLSKHYDPDHLHIKAELKRDFLTRMGFNVAPEVPLGGIVSRLAQQKGFELMFDSLPQILAWREFALVVLGSGDPKYEQFFTQLQTDFPGRVVFRRGYDEPLSHWIEAASDLFLMPSLYEPCGLNQMYSLRYGTVPIVRKTGGLADSVEHYNPDTGVGTGIVFNDFNTEALEWALNTALDLYAAPTHWIRMMRNGMRRDFSWQHQGALYVQLYDRLLYQPQPV
jgi:starch synthase